MSILRVNGKKPEILTVKKYKPNYKKGASPKVEKNGVFKIYDFINYTIESQFFPKSHTSSQGRNSKKRPKSTVFGLFLAVFRPF